MKKDYITELKEMERIHDAITIMYNRENEDSESFLEWSKENCINNIKVGENSGKS
jgi:hypothetical protein